VLTVAAALERIDREAGPLAAEPVSLSAAAGRVLASDVAAAGDYPSFETTAMDGYAVNGPGPEWRDRPGTIGAGAAPVPPLLPGEAARVMTGAPVPAGAETIIPVENADLSGGTLRTASPPEPGAHIRRRGEVFRAGETLLRAGERLSPESILLLATAGAVPVSVVRRPDVVIGPTGAELVDAGSPVAPGQTR